MKCPIPDVTTECKGTYAHLELVGPSLKAKETLEWVFGCGGSAVRSGPYTNQRMYPKVDTERFLIVAHVPVEGGE